MTTGLYGSLFAQVDPLRLAEDERSKRTVEEYGGRLPKDLTSCAVQRHRTPGAVRPARPRWFQPFCRVGSHVEFVRKALAAKLHMTSKWPTASNSLQSFSESLCSNDHGGTSRNALDWTVFRAVTFESLCKHWLAGRCCDLAGLHRTYGSSRETGHKWLQRFLNSAYRRSL